MALPNIVRGTYVSLLLGNADGPPETFAALCGINTRTFTHQGNTSDVFTRDCADPENVPVRRLIVTGEQWDLSGAGQMNRNDRVRLEGAMNITRNWRFLLDEPSDDPVADFPGYYMGPAILTNRTITGADEDFVNIDLTIASDGVWTWVDAA